MWDFRPHEKIAPSNGGDFCMHAEHEKFAPHRFIHDHRLWENHPSIV